MMGRIWRGATRFLEDKNWWLENRWLLTFLTLVLAGVGSWFIWRLGVQPWYAPAEAGPLHLASKATLIMLTALVGWFLDIFTGEADRRKVAQMVTFCYVFPFAIFGAILIPLFAYPETLPTPPKPIGLVLGCAETPREPRDQKLVPDGIRCGNASDQWLVNIGGDAHPISREERAAREAAADAQRVAQDKARTEADAAAKKAKAAEAEKLAKAKPQPKDPAADAAKAEEKARADEKAAADLKAAIDAQAALEKAKVDEKLKSEQAQATEKPRAQDPSKLADKGKSSDEEVKHYAITGGLVVPLYYVILSVFGGFVSMLRRVPEYQERMSAGAAEPLTDSKAREKLVFEVLQLLAAPLIAITAYYLVEPASRSSAIALAFIAGFSSETVLLYVRALAEKIQPETSRRTPEIELVPTSLDFKDVAVSTTSPPHEVKLTNRTATILSGTVNATGDFDCTPHGAFTVAPASAVSFNVTFRPKSAGRKTGALEIKDNGPNSPRTVKLAGTGVQKKQDSPARSRESED